ncbi:FAD/FMN-containing dehydrogenase [Nonomuraea muscovyensis]|uniref:FAD/FMN-containing dehydrogenase n=1 Tax=Nonomuraea muscovyensis TaxID=1124761 RepID=A0A7X0F014_9ACTN|nr:FAD-binding oxidoreductase [Nonomuraea muscovyensis]MBB6350807.1 FAD/FMN-containing dehydrogenase [Nonomuraea muscovyensis]
MDRRDFLHTAAAAPLLGALDRQARDRGGAAPDWARLRRRLAGTLVLPGDARYGTARRLFNPAYDTVRPRGVAYCAAAADVSRCLAFVREHRLPVTARSGGHSYPGWSTGTGLVVDVSRMDAVRYRDGRATIGAGAKLIDVYAKLARHGVSIPAGTCPTVGLSGLALGGGIGVMSRMYGLTCDMMESVDIVTADGRLLTCDERRHPDLFWACRGGGGGNFGVAVSFTFRTHPARDLHVFFLSWPWSTAAATVRAWQAWAPGAPDELWSSLALSRGAGGPEVRLSGVHLGGRAVLDRLLGSLVARAGRPSSRSVTRTSHLEAMKVMGGCSSLSVAQCHPAPHGRLGRAVYVAKSHLAYRPLPPDGVRALVAGVARPGRHMVMLDALGGAVARVRPDATAFPHRAALFSVQYNADGRDRTWLRRVHADLAPHLGDHAYVNYADPDLTSWRTAYYGANAARLAQVKTAYDPARVFRLPQGF